MPGKTELRKLNSKQVDKLKGKLLEIRRVGAQPIFIECAKSNTIGECLKKADVPTDDSDIKVEAQKSLKSKWEVVSLSTKAMQFMRIAVTTKVEGGY